MSPWGYWFFYKESLSDEFETKVLDSTYEGVLSVQFSHRVSKHKTVINICYLPPENSKWGRNCTDFFAHLTNELYRTADVDLVLYAGDFNARIGKQKDYIEEVDTLPSRKN